jgi:histidinol phosphatase-like enzyme
MKLAILDKDGTLIEPKSGAKFPESPEDQQLLPGVRDAIERLKAEGWTIAIASNQGGCDWAEKTVDDLRVGLRFQIPNSTDIFTVENIWGTNDGDIIDVITDCHNMLLSTTDRVLIQYKTIEQAAKEIAFAADLCGITWGFFCPDMLGMTCIEVEKTTEYLWGCNPTPTAEWKHGSVRLLNPLRRIRKFRKPYPGMLQQAKEYVESDSEITDRLMIGDRPEDEQAAHAAEFRFLWADAWRDGAEKCN